MAPGVRLGVDVGSVRVGVAESDPDGILATPVATITDADPVAALAELVTERAAYLVYLGLPRSLDGSEGPAARIAREFAVRLAVRIAPARVRLVDERLTTVSSHRRLRESGRPGRAHREVVDQVAAVLILQTALDHERATGQEPGEPVASGRKPRRKDRA